jgi:microcystin-dependent protein
MREAWLGEIALVAYSPAPAGWALCNGQLLAVEKTVALFSLLGTTHGGDGNTTFALPNLQSRIALQFGEGTGLNYIIALVSSFPSSS